MTTLVTGGAGYIGSHFVRMLQKKGKNIVIADNLSRGHIESIPSGINFIKVDLKDYKATEEIFKKFSIDSIVHFAAYAYVGESVEHPELYYENNVLGSFNLIKAAKNASVKKFVFSSTCSLYGNPLNIPINEDESTKPINPYAYTKLFIEKILSDFDTAYGLKYVALRYFNAAGADFEGEIGESHFPEPHLIPIVLYTALKKRDFVSIFGDNYNTPDGTCIRDYIHIYDLADAHLRALDYLNNGGNSDIFNLGTGNGNSVKEIIDSAKKITKLNIPYKIEGRRAGDPDILVADNKKAKEILGWSPKYNLDDIISSAFNWHKNQKH
ncbi:MAG TPA: UDP-glucose 4-epimerase GalE [Melioribacteraceae bacterium]|nr:UDP-glucose 4-epimerase GalE [Melioribacteraceae bacterium]